MPWYKQALNDEWCEYFAGSSMITSMFGISGKVNAMMMAGMANMIVHHRHDGHTETITATFDSTIAAIGTSNTTIAGIIMMIIQVPE